MTGHATPTPALWRALVAELNGGRTPDGEPGIRDVDAECEYFDPVGAPFERAAGDGECETDGHYLCEECRHIAAVELRRRRDLCRECGAPITPSGDCTAGCDDWRRAGYQPAEWGGEP